MVASLLTWQIYKYSTWTNILHHFFPSGFKGKIRIQVQQTNSTPDRWKLWKLATRKGHIDYRNLKWEMYFPFPCSLFRFVNCFMDSAMEICRYMWLSLIIILSNFIIILEMVQKVTIYLYFSSLINVSISRNKVGRT